MVYKRLVAFLLAVLISINGASAMADTVNVNKTALYQSNNNFSLTEDSLVTRMCYGSCSLGSLSVEADVMGESTFQDTQSLIVKKGTSASFSYTNIKNMVNVKYSTTWHIVEDNAKTINGIDFGDKILKGGFAVQKSHDGTEWTTVYQNTNVFANHKSTIEKFYTASRADLNEGCFYRVIIAYKTERKTKDSKFLWIIDTSSYEKKWHVEMYQIFMLADEEYSEAPTVSVNDVNPGTTIDAGTTGFGNQSAANSNATMETFTWGNGGVGMAAEAANVHSYAEEGIGVSHVGGNNAANGADYVITKDGIITQIQCKYYGTATETISACFDNGSFRYYSDTGIPMTVEVPKDQYERCVELMRNRILKGQVPGVTDPDKASDIIKPGSVTYKQAANLAKAGTIQSLKYDAKTGCVSALGAMGISAVVQFAISIWNHEPVETALKNSLYTGLRVGGNAFISSVLANQLTRTGLNSLLVPASEAVIKVIGPKAAAVIVNASRVGLTPIYGAAAMKSAARMLRGGVIVNTISFLV